MTPRRSALLCATLALVLSRPLHGGDAKKGDAGFTVDKDARTVTVACKVAPRKLPNLKQIYPIEVMATFPAPKGQKAHETVVTFDAKPSAIHKALEGFGLKAGKPGLGEGAKPSGPEVKLFLEFTADGATKKIPLQDSIVDEKTGKALPKLKWLFTGSVMRNPDPEKDDTVYGADLSGTLATIFPVTDDTVFQSTLSKKDEGRLRLEVNKKLLPPEGTAVKLIIQVP